MVKRSLKLAEGFFAIVGAVCTMYFIAACLMPDAAEKVVEEDDDYIDYVDPHLDDDPEDDEDDDDVPEDDGK